jgi:hypothetical protein
MSHFAGKDAKGHIEEKKAEGSAIEIHGLETPGYLGAGSDALRETALFLLLLSFLHPSFSLFLALSLGIIAWKTGRSAWLGWMRLERLHRLIAQEKYEIEHHRPQEREELVALYGGKGFSGKLLDEIVDHLMADDDRLLKVMLEEEMGLTLEAYEHPLKQALGAFCGALLSAAVFGHVLFYWGEFAASVTAFALIACGAAFSAFHERNGLVAAIVWNLAIAGLSYALVTFFQF